jgi:signal transduction histidine kinase
MRRPGREPSAAAAATISAPGAAPVLLTLDPPPGSDWVPEGTVAADSAELTRHLTEDHDRIAREMNDVVIHRIFAAGLDLQATLGLIGDQRVASKICHAIDELDQAIRDIRDAIFDCGPRSFSAAGRTTESRLITSPDSPRVR